MAEKEYIEREAILDYIDECIPRMVPNKQGHHPILMEVVRNFIAAFETVGLRKVR